MRLARRRLKHTTTGASLALAAALAAGCQSTPDHSNTLIFGTTTKVALDVSQDPTGTLGVTLGYRRNEAVWMPLLPNKNGRDQRQAVDCTAEKTCPKFVGTDGTDVDTYSVFASFGGKGEGGTTAPTPAGEGGTAGGTAAGAQVRGEIAQYFATGLAARALADRGGAAVVNTAVDPLAASITAEERAEILAARRVKLTTTDAFAEKVSKDGVVDKGLVDAMFQKAPLKNETKTLKIVTNFVGKPTAELRGYFSRNTRALPVDKMNEAMQ